MTAFPVRRAPCTGLPGSGRRGIALPEALVAITLLSLAGSTLLLTLDSALDAGHQAIDQVLAQGIAEGLMEEICRQSYKEQGGAWNQPVLGPGLTESNRSMYDDVDDYHGYQSMPPTDRWGHPIGAGDGRGGLRPAELRLTPLKLDAWRTRVLVRYVSETNQSQLSALPTRYRRIDVFVERQVDGTWQEITRASRLVGYTPGVVN